VSTFDIRTDGSLANRRVYAQLPDDVNPDGIALGACRRIPAQLMVLW
jgi:hypothetical protein